MPIKPENRKLYPKNWKTISCWIRFERAEGRCECRGECGDVHGIPHHGRRCTRLHGEPIVGRTARVILTVAHLDHDPENQHPMNLKAMCQRCHLLLDREQHQKNAAETRRKRQGQLALPI